MEVIYEERIPRILGNERIFIAYDFATNTVLPFSFLYVLYLDCIFRA
jgi:hypothetical protein